MPTPRRATAHATQRATVHVIGTLLLVVVTVVLAVTLSTAVLGGASAPEPAATAALDLSVDGETLIVTHTDGEPLDIEGVSMEIAVDNEPLDEQPPVPFFAASGFESGPTGAFNPAGSTELVVGESASLTVASTNSPTIEAGTTVTVTLYDGSNRLLETETTV